MKRGSIFQIGVCAQVRRYRRLKQLKGLVAANAYVARKMRSGIATPDLMELAADLIDPQRSFGRPAGGIAETRAIRIGKRLERERAKKTRPIHEAEADLAEKLAMDVRNVQMSDKLYKDGMRNFHEEVERAYRGFGRRQRK